VVGVGGVAVARPLLLQALLAFSPPVLRPQGWRCAHACLPPSPAQPSGTDTLT
jgi:hypothetical protein